jgi:predicted  nucleic acid-binding Zn-ribbon protein
MEKFKATPAQPNENTEFLENHSSNKETLKKKLFDIQIKLKDLDNSIYNISLSTDSKTRKQFFNERRKISSEYNLISNEYKKCINTEYRNSLEHKNPPSFSFESLKKCYRYCHVGKWQNRR